MSLDPTIPPSMISIDAPEEMSFSDIYNQLLITDELILTIAPEQEEALRKGLASVKYKQNQKFAEQNLPTDRAQLQFDSYPSKTVAGAIDVHITLTKPRSIKVIAVHLPDPEL